MVAVTAAGAPSARRRRVISRRWMWLVVLAVLVVLGGLAVWAVATQWPKPGVHVWTVVADATGLQRGSPVTLAGIRVGTVEHVGLTDDNTARVDLRIDTDVAKRLRGPGEKAACDARPMSPACGTHFVATYLPDFATPTKPRRLVIHPGGKDGLPIASGAYVPCDEESFRPLLEALQDERIVRDLPRELAALIPEARAALRGLERSPVTKMMGAGAQPSDKKKGDKAKPDEKKPDEAQQNPLDKLMDSGTKQK